MKKQIIKNENKLRRKKRVRAKVSGTALKPRISIFRSLKHISAQMIDDVAGKTILAVSDKEVTIKGNKTEKALAVGKLLAEKAKAAKVVEAVFDKGPFKYHGRVKALADGAREGGLKI